MKKIIVVLVILIAVSSTAQKINFGIKAGLNVSMLTGNANEIMSSNNGFFAGALLELKILGKIAIQPELLFSTQGAKFESKDLTYATTTKMNYIILPVMVKYYPVAGLFVEAGPQAGFLISAKKDIDNRITNVSTSENIKEATKDFDMSINAGVGYDILDKVVAQVRYCIGLTNTSTLANTDIKNGVFQLSVGYKF
jgi:hypothetical protein